MLVDYQGAKGARADGFTYRCTIVVFLRPATPLPISPFTFGYGGNERLRYAYDMIKMWELDLTPACEPCNQRKGAMTATEFGYPEVHDQAKQPLKDVAIVNTTRLALYERLQATELPVERGTVGAYVGRWPCGKPAALTSRRRLARFKA